MSSIRSRQPQNLPGANINSMDLPGPTQPQNQRFYNAIFSQGAIQAMSTLQTAIAAALAVPVNAQTMNTQEWTNLEKLAGCGKSLAAARKKCGGGGWSRAQQQWANDNGGATQHAADGMIPAGETGEFVNQNRQNATYQDPSHSRDRGLAAAGAR